MSNELLRQAQKDAAWSYLHKVLLLIVAVLGFQSLHALSELKREHGDLQKVQYTAEGLVALVAEASGSERALTLPPVPGGVFSTREQMEAALKDQAEARVWSEFHQVVAGWRKEMARLQQLPVTDARQREYARYADLVGREEAYARTRAQAVRQRLGAQFAALDVKPLRKTATGLKARLSPTLDPDNDLYVLYQILWYASLFVGVGAASLLLVVLLTALPITDGEGYWTAKIRELLSRTPSIPGARHSVAAPLLAAMIGGGTMLGTIAETVPGGTARPPADPIIYTCREKCDSELQVTSETNNSFELTVTSGPHDPPRLPPQPPIDLGPVTSALHGVQTAVEKEGRKVTEAVTSSGAATARAINEKIDVTANATNRILEATDGKLGPARDSLKTIDATLATVPPAVTTEAAAVRTKVGDSAEAIEKQSADIAAKEDARAKASLAYAAERDPRGAFLRMFGFTQYRISPGVIQMMEARVTNELQRAALSAALKKLSVDAKTGEPIDRSRWELESALRKELGVEYQRLANEQLPALLRVAAMPRW